MVFEDAAQFEAWVSEHYADQAGVWLKLAKKGCEELIALQRGILATSA